jgi:hypothetical protein
MVEQPKDHAETDHEEEVLTRWQRLKTWWEIAKTARAIAMAIKVMVWGTAGTAVIDVATDGTLLRDGAVEVGLIDKPFTPPGFVPHEHDWRHEHELVWPEHTHEFVEHQHDTKPVVYDEKPHQHTLPDHDHPHTHPEIQSIPDNHGALH